ncbi:ATP-binding protein [Caenibius tardaugens NBRC 16725]|nr:ATP-binding protein [Caenibius tardaugens NBRC 16725]
MKGGVVRAVRGHLEAQLDRYGCALILGPRQVGKTFLARQLAGSAADATILLDMQTANDRKQVQDFHHFHEANAGKLIILDEAQEAPELFPELRACLDRREFAKDSTRWLLLGSAAAQLTQLAGQLGGRYGEIDLWPFQMSELTSKLDTSSAAAEMGEVVAQTAAQAPAADDYDIQHRMWLRGGFPDSYLAESEQASLEWRSSYLRSLTDPAFIPKGALERPDLVKPMWEHLAVSQGEPMLLDKAAQRLGCKVNIIRELLAHLHMTRLVRVLRPWFPNEGKRIDKPARFFIRDSGLLHENWNFAAVDDLRANPLCGKSWEGFVLEALSLRKPKSAELYFYRNDNKQEIDIVVDFGADRRWAIEVKLGDDTAPKAGFYDAVAEVGAERAFVINGGRESLEPGNGKVPIFCLADALALIHQPDLAQTTAR